MFRFTTIKDYHTALLAGEMSCVQAVTYYLDQIEHHKTLNAFLEVFTDDAKQRAIELDELRAQNKSLGKLHGVVVGIKDVLCF
ncbi:MAG: amidase family protein, partial [Sediminibacterium sp.]